MLTVVPDVSVPSCGLCAHQPPANPSSLSLPLPSEVAGLTPYHYVMLTQHVCLDGKLERCTARSNSNCLPLLGFCTFPLSAHPHRLHAIPRPFG